MRSRVATAGNESNGCAEPRAVYPWQAANDAECHRSSRKTEESRAKEPQKTRGTDASGRAACVSFRDTGLELRRKALTGAKAALRVARLGRCLESVPQGHRPELRPVQRAQR